MAMTELRQFVALQEIRAVAFDGLPDGVQQILLPYRFRQELNRTGLHGAYRHGDVAVTREKYDRQHRTGCVQIALQIQSTQSGELNVQHQTARHVGSPGGEKRLRRGKGLDLEPRGSQQPPQRLTE